MPFQQIVLSLIVEEKDLPQTTELLLAQVDALVRDSVCVFDSKITSTSVDVPDANEIRDDLFLVRKRST